MTPKDPAAIRLGRRGGSAKTPEQQAARRRLMAAINARKRCRKCGNRRDTQAHAEACKEVKP